MSIRDLQNDCIEIQGDVVYGYYDHEAEELVEIPRDVAIDREIKYMYCQNNKLYIEVSAEND